MPDIKERMARSYPRGLVWIDRVRVATWSDGKLFFNHEGIDGLNLPWKACDIEKAWKKEMAPAA